WAAGVWQGSDYTAWLRLLFRNNFAVEPSYWYIAAIASVVTIGNMALKWIQENLHGDRIRDTELVGPPVFVVGHWRTGTTLLHELLVLDSRHTSPTTLQCFVPNHFLLTEGLLKKYGMILVPDRRPMDNMATGWDKPQEDEFALCLLGLPSPYADMAFPNRPPTYPGSLDLSGLTPMQLAHWKRTFVRFLRALTYRDPRRRVYDAVELGEFEAVRPRLEEFARGAADYETNNYPSSEADRAEVAARWGDVIRRYGYGAS